MKRLIVIMITVVMLMLPAQVLADSKGPLSYEKSVSFLKTSSNTLKKLQRAENNAYKEYQSNLLDAGNIDVNGFTVTFYGEDHYIYYDAGTRISMTKLKELVPEQLKFSWEAAKASRQITENTLKATLRNVYLGLYSADNEQKLKQEQLALADEINRQNNLKWKNGMITALDLEESGYNLLKAKKNVDAASRNYENAVRNLNQFVGVSPKMEYSGILYEEKPASASLKPVENYIDAALENRFDIISIRRQIALKEQDKKLTDAGNIHKVETGGQNTYESLLNDIEALNVDLEATKLTISDEIKNAYVDVISSGKSLNSMYNTVKLQRSSFEKMQARYKAGMISKNILTQTELGLLQAENGYKAMLFDYNTKIMRFNNATGIGPGY